MADYAWKLKGNRLSPVPAFFRHFSTVNCCPQLISPPVVALTTEGGQIERERENERDRERKRGLHVPRRPTTAIKVTLIAMTVNSQRISLRAAWRGRWKFRWNLSFTRTSSNYPGKPVFRWFAQATYELNQYFSTWGVSLAREIRIILGSN